MIANRAHKQRRNIVVSGVGVVSPFGVGATRFFDALAASESAIGPIRSFEASSFPTRVAGQVPVVDPTADWLAAESSASGRSSSAQLTEFLGRWQSFGAFRDRKVGFAWLAGCEAWAQGQCSEQEREAWLCLGLGLEQAFLEDFAPFFRGETGIDWDQIKTKMHSREKGVTFRSEVDLSARLLSEWLGLSGPALINSSACAAGTMAVAQAASWIRRGLADIVVCGAADSMVNPLGVGGMSRLGAPSPRASADACRPFDRKRDGLVMGEGAAFFVLEEEERALKRGGRPIARVLGWATTQDGYRVTAPRPDGAKARQAMQRAIDLAGISAQDIGYINAHGTGTPLNDPAEAQAIRAVFGGGARAPKVSSIKGAVGHLMAASGAIEFAACLLPFERGYLPGTAHLSERDPQCDVDVIGPRALKADVDFVLSNSFGFGGQNASIVLGRYSR